VPPLAIVVYADLHNRELGLFEFDRLKVYGVILTGTTDQPPETRRAVAEALCAADAFGVTDALVSKLHPLGLECLRWAIEQAQDSPSVERLSEAFSLDLRGAGAGGQLPSPAHFIFWGRLFRAASLFSDADWRTEDVAFRLNHSSASALTRTLRRETGCSLRELRRRGTTACVLDGFLRHQVRNRARGR
jgi:AraC-like DNA-binding protein